MSKNRKAATEPRPRVPWADQAIPLAGVPSGVHAVRDDRGRLVEVIVPFWARREVKGAEVPAGIEAVHLIAMATVDYVDALVQLLRTAPASNEERHTNMLLCALASLVEALFVMDCSAFAGVCEAPRRADGQLALSAHEAVIDVLKWSVTWAERALKDFEKKPDGKTPLETSLAFFTRLHAERFLGAADVDARLRAVVDQLDPRMELADWVSAKVLLRREVTQLRAAARARQLAKVPPLGMNLRQQILWICRDGDSKGLRKWTQVAEAIGNTSADGSSVRREGGRLEKSRYLEKTQQGYRTTAKGLGLLPKSVSEEHTL